MGGSAHPVLFQIDVDELSKNELAGEISAARGNDDQRRRPPPFDPCAPAPAPVRIRERSGSGASEPEARRWVKRARSAEAKQAR